ncbi:hypothetical protein ABMY26_22860 [Azospirillum sp. HJ39]|uniref:hypothetical protein n=1 Tax=Azospirillum sp. HJ39 TaxID=3159496 RepID=UPI003556B3EA
MEMLLAARRIADHAKDEGVLYRQVGARASCQHMGGILADAVLQSGLNYKSVVRPRVVAILRLYPEKDTTSSLMEVVEEGMTSSFLNWNHPQKIARFERLVCFLQDRNIELARDLKNHLQDAEFCEEIQGVNGVGPKTVDYMACLVGVDSIAVDRHVRNFAKRVGVSNDDYLFLRKVFCFAADLLELSRRDFDAWIWSRESSSSSRQLSFAV